MAVFLLCLVVTGVVFLACYIGWYIGQKKKYNVPEAVRVQMEIKENKGRILENVYKGAKNRKKKIPGSGSLKIAVMEGLNINPDMMKACLKELKKETLVIESDEHIALTTFGVQFYEVFGRKPQRKRKK